MWDITSANRFIDRHLGNAREFVKKFATEGKLTVEDANYLLSNLSRRNKELIYYTKEQLHEYINVMLRIKGMDYRMYKSTSGIPDDYPIEVRMEKLFFWEVHHCKPISSFWIKDLSKEDLLKRIFFVLDPANLEPVNGIDHEMNHKDGSKLIVDLMIRDGVKSRSIPIDDYNDYNRTELRGVWWHRVLMGTAEHKLESDSFGLEETVTGLIRDDFEDDDIDDEDFD